MKKFFITLLGIVFCTVAYSQSDFDVAQRFMSKKGITLADNRAVTRGNTEPYSVFNGEDGKGFAIVVNGAVVGYSTDNSASEIPEQLKEMLKAYKASTRSEGKDYPEEFTPRNVTPIEPLIKTKWSQGYPYNEMCPLNDEGKRTITGCAATALAQVLYYYRLPYGCDEFTGEYNYESCYHEYFSYLPATKFDWDNMFLEYHVGTEYTKENLEAVGKLMIYCGALTHCEYGKHSTLGILNPNMTSEKEDIFSRFLHYDGSNKYTNYTYSDDEMVKVIDEALEDKRPIIDGANSENNGHYFIIDGRDSDGLFHMNWGWGGACDGYFIVSTELFNKYGEKHNLSLYGKFNVLTIPYATLEYSTGIERVDTKTNYDGAVYNLQGQKVGDSLEGVQRGMYIMNGKKYIVK